jgi:hypothetical protein
LDEHLDARPGEDAGHKGYPAPRGLHDRLVDLVQREDAPAVAHLGMQAGEEGLDAAEGQRLPALDQVPLQVLLHPRPVRSKRQVMVASQRIYQPLKGALGIAQVDLQQACLVGREGTELLLLLLYERLHLLMHDLGGRGPETFELLPEGSERDVGWRGQEVRAAARRARVAQGACTVSRPWWSKTPKPVTVSQRGLEARRTLVRSSVERGIVIMVVQPLSNCTHSKR